MNNNYTLADLSVPESIRSFIRTTKVTNLKTRKFSLATKVDDEKSTHFSVEVEGVIAKYPCAWLYPLPDDKQTLVLISRQTVYVLDRTKYGSYVPSGDSDEWENADLVELGIVEE